MCLWLRGSSQNLWRVRQPVVEIGSDALSRHIPRTFDLVALPRPILLRVFRAVPAVQSAAFERIDVAEALRALVLEKSGSTISSRSSSGARGYGHRDDSAWKGAGARGEGEVPMRGAGELAAGAGAGPGMAAATIGTGS